MEERKMENVGYLFPASGTKGGSLGKRNTLNASPSMRHCGPVGETLRRCRREIASLLETV